jgi:hypothetical protein
MSPQTFTKNLATIHYGTTMRGRYQGVEGAKGRRRSCQEKGVEEEEGSTKASTTTTVYLLTINVPIL